MKRKQLQKYFDFQSLDALDNDTLQGAYDDALESHGTSHIETRAARAVLVERGLIVSKAFATKVRNLVGWLDKGGLDAMYDDAITDAEIMCVLEGMERINSELRLRSIGNAAMKLIGEGRGDLITKALKS